MATPTSRGDITRFFTGSGINNIDALLFGSKWNGGVGKPGAVTFSFADGDSEYSTSSFFGYGSTSGEGEPFNGLEFLSTSQKAGVREAISAWASVANIAFTEVNDSSTVAGDLRFAFTDNTVPGAIAHAYLPFGSATAGDVWFNSDMESANFGAGGASYFIALHEIGHAAMGFIDVSDFDGLNDAFLSIALDSNQWTVMSYYVHEDDDTVGTDPFDNEDHPTTPMWLDIQAAQFVYGANVSFNSGNTVYRWDVGAKVYMTLWDGGGIDTIDWSNQSRAAKINLQTGEWNTLGPILNLGDDITSDENLIIYQGVVIENARGGSGADRIVGNGTGNTLTGGGGGDVLVGGGGNDRLDGGAGIDRLEGGAGGDTYVITVAGDKIVELAGKGIDKVISAITFTLPTTIEDLTLGGTADIDGNGNAARNTLVGNSGDNILRGFDGADLLNGGRGHDALRSGDGADRLFFHSRLDVGTVQTNVTRAAAGVDGDTAFDFVSGVDRFMFREASFDPGRDIGLGQVDSGESFSIIGGAFNGTNAGANSNHDAGLATFIYSLADHTLYYDDNGDAAGYTVVAEVGADTTIVARDVVLIRV